MSAIVANVAVDVFQMKPLSNDRHDRSDRRLDKGLNHLISADSMLFMKEEQKIWLSAQQVQQRLTWHVYENEFLDQNSSKVLYNSGE